MDSNFRCVFFTRGPAQEIFIIYRKCVKSVFKHTYTYFMGLVWRIFLKDSHVQCAMPIIMLMISKYKKKGKDQELIQSRTTPDLGHHMGK